MPHTRSKRWHRVARSAGQGVSFDNCIFHKYKGTTREELTHPWSCRAAVCAAAVASSSRWPDWASSRRRRVSDNRQDRRLWHMDYCIDMRPVRSHDNLPADSRTARPYRSRDAGSSLQRESARYCCSSSRQTESAKSSLTTRIPIGFNVVRATAIRRRFTAIGSRPAYVPHQAEAKRTWRSAEVDRFHLR